MTRRVAVLATLLLATATTLALAPRPLRAADPPAHTAGVEASADGAHGGDGHAKPELIPSQLDKQVVMSAIWVLIIFLVLLLILYPTAWKNVLAGLKAREERIRKDIADAEAARARSEATLKEYSAKLATAEGTIREMLSKATVDAEKISQNIRMKAQEEGEQLKERAQKEIEAATRQAIDQLREETVVLATNMAEKIVRRSLNPQDQRDLLARSLEELQTVGSR